MVEQISAALGLVAILLLLGLIWGPWQTLCVDWARQRLFEARARLFDLAASGKLSFESVEYQEIRRSFETLIRFMHKATWVSVLSAMLTHKPKERTPDFVEAVERIQDPVAKKIAKRQIRKACEAVILQLVFRSIFLWVVLLLVYLVWTFHRSFGGFVRAVTSKIYFVLEKEAKETDRIVGQSVSAHSNA